MPYQWAEDDCGVPAGVGQLGLSAPVSDQTYVMYHGTTSQNAQAILHKGFYHSADGMLGRGIYLSRDLEKARRYPLNYPEYDKVIIKVLVNVGKVIAITYKNHPLQKTWHDHGYDTAWVPRMCGMVSSGLEEDCVWDPNRIRIIEFIKPQPVQPVARNDPRHTDTMQYQWAEDDCGVPAGVGQLGLSAPVSDQTYVMYHGTTGQNAQAILHKGFYHSADGMLGRGIYLSRDLEKARRYPLNYPEYDKVIIKVLVNVGKVIAITYKNHPLQKTWHDHGYDTAWVPPMCGMVSSGLEEDCVWDPNRIRIIKFINPQPVQPVARNDPRWSPSILLLGLGLLILMTI